jgi:HK97 family phage portal protein
MMDLFKKGIGGSPASSMFGGGWQGALSSRYRTGPNRLAALQNAYGGTEDSVVWVFACVSLIGETLASYPKAYNDPATDEVLESPPADLVSLLEQPNPNWTWFDLVEAVLGDLELVGNAYILKNETNGLGQPKTLFRLRPDRTKVAVAPDGTEIGYVYTPNTEQANLSIPYDFEEVIHFRYPNPLDDHYGMGTVEAISAELDLDTASRQHVTGYFQNGARISGVLTVPETMTDTQFERLKDSWRENYSGPASAYKILIAEGASDYKAMSQTPIASGVVDLAKLSKDSILSGFGVPAPLLGGVMENANYKMEESQHVFTRGMIPRARRLVDRLNVDLIGLWGVKLTVDVHANEPLEIRIAHAKEMLGAGATINQGREAMGLPRSTDAMADEILIPNNLIPLRLAGAPPRPGASIPMEANPEPGAVAAGAAPAQLPAGTAHEQALSDQLGEMATALNKLLADNAGIKRVASRSAKRAAEDAEAAWRGKASRKTAKAESAPEVAPPTAPLVWTLPTYPAGYEAVNDPGHDVGRAVREHQAAFHSLAVPEFETFFKGYFKAQRNRVLTALSGYGTSATHRREGKAKTDLTADGLFNEDSENTALVPGYLATLDTVGGQALPQPLSLGGGLSWDTVNPRIASLRTGLGEKIVGINATTKDAISNTVAEGLRRGYSVTQIANGYSDENYAGVLGVFDQADGYRSEMIARTESAYAYNGAQAADFAEGGVEWVQILDGDGDEGCAEASDAVWTLDDYESDPIEHPNCVRAAVPSDVDDAGNPVGGDSGGGEGAGDDAEAAGDDADATAADAPATPDEIAAADEVVAKLPNSTQLAQILAGNATSWSTAAEAENVAKVVYQRTQQALVDAGVPERFTAFRGHVGTETTTDRIDGITEASWKPRTVADGAIQTPVTINRADVLADPSLFFSRSTRDQGFLLRDGAFTPGAYAPAGSRLGELPEDASDLRKVAQALDPTTVTAAQLQDLGTQIQEASAAKLGPLQDAYEAVDTAYLASFNEQFDVAHELKLAKAAFRRAENPKTQARLDAAEAAVEANMKQTATLFDERNAAYQASENGKASAFRAVLSEIRDFGGSLNVAPGSDPALVARVEKALEDLPSSWLDAANRTGSVKIESIPVNDKYYGRAYYSHNLSTGDGTVRLTEASALTGMKESSDSVVLHEISHRMEYVTPDLMRVEEDFLQGIRIGQPQQLSVITKLNDYKPEEMAYQTTLPSQYAYIGKVYARQADIAETAFGMQGVGLYNEIAGEVFTMAQEGLWYETRNMALYAPQINALVLGILAVL